jgi:hypothetical protein
VVLLKSHGGVVVEASLRLGPGPRLGSEEVHKTADLVVVLAEITNDYQGGANGSGSGSTRCHSPAQKRRAHWGDEFFIKLAFAY